MEVMAVARLGSNESIPVLRPSLENPKAWNGKTFMYFVDKAGNWKNLCKIWYAIGTNEFDLISRVQWSRLPKLCVEDSTLSLTFW